MSEEVKNQEEHVQETEKKRRKQYDVSAVQVCQVWQTSKSSQEAADILNMPKSILLARISSYRKEGAKLKSMPRKNPRKIDIETLNTIIANATAENNE